jgi:hypothetical protein
MAVTAWLASISRRQAAARGGEVAKYHVNQTKAAKLSAVPARAAYPAGGRLASALSSISGNVAAAVSGKLTGIPRITRCRSARALYALRLACLFSHAGGLRKMKTALGVTAGVCGKTE